MVVSIVRFIGLALVALIVVAAVLTTLQVAQQERQHQRDTQASLRAAGFERESL